MQWRKLFYFLLINVFVSTLTTLGVLYLWDRTHRTNRAEIVREMAAVVFPTETPASRNEEIPLQFYVVGPQDTLDGIALTFGVQTDELLALNGISDRDAIGVGDQLIVPAATSGNSQIEIIVVTTPGDLDSERVRIQNNGEIAVSLSGWLLEDEDNHQFRFPQLTLYTGAIDVYSRAGVDKANELYWAASVAIWESGETITLRDAAGSIQAQSVVK